MIGRVLFDHGTLPGSFKDIPHKNTICRKPITAVIRDEYFLTGYQAENALKDLAHRETLASSMILALTVSPQRPRAGLA
ncbi:MAG: hypothetical protein WCD04_02425 [Terriglobia bacterium]